MLCLTNLYQKLSNFQLSLIAGQAKEYLAGDSLNNKKCDYSLLEKINFCDMNISVCNIMEVYGSRTWKLLYAIECNYINKGEYLKALFIRRLNQKCAVLYDKNKGRITNSFFLAWSYFFEGNNESARKIVSRELKCPLINLVRSKLLLLNYIFSGNVNTNVLKNNNLSIYDLDVEGKTIRIVGPLAVGRSALNDDHVISVSINCVEDERTQKSGISFYNGGTMERLALGVFRIPQMTKYVFHRVKYTYQNILKKENKLRLTYNCDYIFGLGQPNMLPHILFQVLASNPKAIYVDGFNLYMSKKIYNDAYLNNNSKNNDFCALISSFGVHNLITQYLFIHTLYKMRLIIPDELLKDILEKGIDEYLYNMENLAKSN